MQMQLGKSSGKFGGNKFLARHVSGARHIGIFFCDFAGKVSEIGGPKGAEVVQAQAG